MRLNAKERRGRRIVYLCRRQKSQHFTEVHLERDSAFIIIFICATIRGTLINYRSKIGYACAISRSICRAGFHVDLCHIFLQQSTTIGVIRFRCSYRQYISIAFHTFVFFLSLSSFFAFLSSSVFLLIAIYISLALAHRYAHLYTYIWKRKERKKKKK